jgi:hypothetical protein
MEERGILFLPYTRRSYSIIVSYKGRSEFTPHDGHSVPNSLRCLTVTHHQG